MPYFHEFFLNPIFRAKKLVPLKHHKLERLFIHDLQLLKRCFQFRKQKLILYLFQSVNNLMDFVNHCTCGDFIGSIILF